MHAESPVWSFEEIARCEPSRANLLENAPQAEAICGAILTAFKLALEAHEVRFGMEQSGSNPSDLRATMQFHIGEALSDQFFNANTGYRAEFRRGWPRGLNYNCSIVTQMHLLVAGCQRTNFSARLLTPKFEDSGPLEVSREQLCASLHPDMSKVWFCARLIAGNGQVTQLPSGIVGPRLRLDEHTTWAAIARDEEHAWLDVKGAFVGSSGPYQPKDPIDRAKKLEASGEA